MLDRLRSDDDEGFTLVETLVAMLVLTVMAVTTGALTTRIFGVVKDNGSRVTAANLAQQQVEAVRQKRALDVPEAVTSRTVTVPVNGVAYTVQQTVMPRTDPATPGLCTGAGPSSGVRFAYKLVTVTVTWPGMGSVRPVRQDTLLSLGLGKEGIDEGAGTAAVGVTDGASPAQAQAGVTVTLTPGGAQVVTGADGCAVFSGLVAGTSYSASASQPGFVGASGDTTATTGAFTVTAGGVTRTPLRYARRAAVAATLAAPAGTAPPAGLELTLSSPSFPTGQRVFPECADPAVPHYCVSGTPRTASALFPGAYGAWPGSCTDARSGPPVQVTATSGATASVTLPLAGVRAQVRSGTTPVTGHTVYALHAADGVCAVLRWPLAPPLAADQSLALPPGTWTFALTPDGSAAPAGGWPSAVLSAGAVVPVVVPAPASVAP